MRSLRVRPISAPRFPVTAVQSPRRTRLEPRRFQNESLKSFGCMRRECRSTRLGNNCIGPNRPSVPRRPAPCENWASPGMPIFSDMFLKLEWCRHPRLPPRAMARQSPIVLPPERSIRLPTTAEAGRSRSIKKIDGPVCRPDSYIDDSHIDDSYIDECRHENALVLVQIVCGVKECA